FLNGSDYVYLNNVKNDYTSVSHKQNKGLKYIYDNYNFDFVYCCGTDTYINTEKLLLYMKKFNPNDKLYLGGHGWHVNLGKKDLYFHSGGSGFVLSRDSLAYLYPKLHSMFNNWVAVCKENGVPWVPCCDVTLSYFLQIDGYMKFNEIT